MLDVMSGHCISSLADDSKEIFRDDVIEAIVWITSGEFGCIFIESHGENFLIHVINTDLKLVFFHHDLEAMLFVFVNREGIQPVL